MKVILIKDVPDLGDKGIVAEVKNGFARNYLIPNKFAVPATEGNLRSLEETRKHQERKRKKEAEKARTLAEEITRMSFVIKARSGEGGKLFGSVTSLDIAEALEKQGKYTVDKKRILLDDPLKRLGTHTVQVKLHSDVIADVKVEIIEEDESGHKKIEEEKKAEAKKTGETTEAPQAASEPDESREPVPSESSVG